MTKEKQIEEIQKMLDNASDFHPYFSRVLATKIYNAGYRKQSEWISVDERLPSECAAVIAIVNGRECNINYINAVMLAEYYSDTNEWALAHNPAVTVSVTHWMPLPEPQKGEK